MKRALAFCVGPVLAGTALAGSADPPRLFRVTGDERDAKRVGRMVRPDAPERWFYAVGASRPFAAVGPTAECAGLLEDLGHRGFRVQPVATSSDASST